MEGVLAGYVGSGTAGGPPVRGSVRLRAEPEPGRVGTNSESGDAPGPPRRGRRVETGRLTLRVPSGGGGETAQPESYGRAIEGSGSSPMMMMLVRPATAGLTTRGQKATTQARQTSSPRRMPA